MVDNAAHVWAKKYVYMLLLGYLKCLGDFDVDREESQGSLFEEVG